MSFKNSVPSILGGEKMGDTVVLELKNDIEKLSEENQNLKESNFANVKKFNDLEADLKNEKEKHEINVKGKEAQFKAKLNKLKTEFSAQLGAVDAETQKLDKSLSLGPSLPQTLRLVVS